MVTQKGHVCYQFHHFQLLILNFIITNFQFGYFWLPILNFLVSNFQFVHFLLSNVDISYCMYQIWFFQLQYFPLLASSRTWRWGTLSNFTPQEWGVGAKCISEDLEIVHFPKLKAFLRGDHISFSAFSGCLGNFPYLTVSEFHFLLDAFTLILYVSPLQVRKGCHMVSQTT